MLENNLFKNSKLIEILWISKSLIKEYASLYLQRKQQVNWYKAEPLLNYNDFIQDCQLT